jgi:S1-C subfamily serine protease
VEGVIVLGAKNPLRARNFQLGDVITEVNGSDIRTLDDFMEATTDERRTWKIVINRRGGRVYLTWRG